MAKRYFKIPIAPVEGAFGYDTGDKSTMGYWLAEFEGQMTVRQLELHPQKTPVLLEKGHPDICPHSLDETNLTNKPHLEIFAADFEDEWTSALIVSKNANNAGEGSDVSSDSEDGETGNDAPLPELPTNVDDESSDVSQTTGNNNGTVRKPPTRPPTRPAPRPPASLPKVGNNANFEEFKAMLEGAANDATVEDGDNKYRGLWRKAVTVLSNLSEDDSFDNDAFTRYVFGELMSLD